MRTAPPPTAAAPAPCNPDRFVVASGPVAGAERIVIYGPGGIGKSTLASLAPKPVILDVEAGTRKIDVPRIEGLVTMQDLRDCLRAPILHDFETIVIDSATKVEELAVAHAIATIPHEKPGTKITSVESWGFGKGYQHVYDVFLLFLQDLDTHIRAGRNVILIAHDCTADVPNPTGEDFIRYEPRLQAPKSGKASIRNRVVEWADFVLWLGYDVSVDEGKGKGGGTRTIYPNELPDHIAKSRLRSLCDPIPFTSESDAAVWDAIFAKGGAA